MTIEILLMLSRRRSHVCESIADDGKNQSGIFVILGGRNGLNIMYIYP